jgi:CRISPR-associated protein Cas1
VPAGDSVSQTSEPDYLPARMLNEFVYCPRLFYYEWVEGVFAHNRETVEGALRHKKLDERSDALPDADKLAESGEKLHSRSVMLASDTHRLIAKMDIVEAEGGKLTPVDYKRGSPRRADDGTPEAWDTDSVQLAAQALVLRDNGYVCDEGVIYYVATKQRVRVEFDEKLIGETLAALEAAWRTAAADRIPPPLVDSPKCPRCSLVGICLPDETRTCESAGKTNGRPKQTYLFDDFTPREMVAAAADDEQQVRRLVPARDDLRPLYLDTQGLHVGKSGGVLKIKEKDKVVQAADRCGGAAARSRC